MDNTDNNPTVLNHSVDDYFRATNLGSMEQAIGNNLFGIDHIGVMGAVPINKDHYGYTFFVRPQLNLRHDNVANIRFLYTLLTANATSIQRTTRVLLDPRLSHVIGSQGAPLSVAGGKPGEIEDRYPYLANLPAIDAPLCDPYSPFISILSNNLTSLSGWPDLALPTFTSSKGNYGEEYAIGDGTLETWNTFDMDATFLNTKGSPIIYMFQVWEKYISLVHEGMIMPYLDFIAENTIDYNTRVYRIIMDPTKRYVTNIAACGAAIPISVPTSQVFEFSKEHPYNDQNKDVTIRFKCMGAMYNDPILVQEFNMTQIQFNSDMADANRNKSMSIIDPLFRPLFNNRGYPRINPSTYELEWWIGTNKYINKLRAMYGTGILNKDQNNAFITNPILRG